MAKNFSEYANRRIGLEARPLALNNSEKIIDELIQKRGNIDRDIVAVEFGFNHGNDSRHIIKILLNKLGNTGWQFWGVDHKDFFMPENIFFGFSEEEKTIVQKNVKFLPCYFEDLAINASSLPDQIDYCYSNKSLSMVQFDSFYPFMEQITMRIRPGGIICCSLHVYSKTDLEYRHQNEYIDMLSGKLLAPFSKQPLFRDFESIFDYTDQKYFSFIATKNGINRLTIQEGISNNASELMYENIYNKYTNKERLS